MSLKLIPAEQEMMRRACAFNAQLMDHIRPLIGVGTILADIDKTVYEYTCDHGHRPATLGYRGFPKSLCTSVNDVVCHGIPDDYVLKNGDIVNCDLTTIVEGWHGDQSETFLIGEVSEEARRLVQDTFDATHLGISAAKPNKPSRLIAKAITNYAQEKGHSVVAIFQGHGIGREFHQHPPISHCFAAYAGADKLRPGYCFTVEPMLSVGTADCVISKEDGWTARTANGQLSAQFEHTVLMTKDGPEILTLTKNGPQPGHVF